MSLPTLHAGRVLGTLPGGGGSEGKEVRMKELGTQGEERSQKQNAILDLSIKCCLKMCNANDESCTVLSESREVASLCSVTPAPRKRTRPHDGKLSWESTNSQTQGWNQTGFKTPCWDSLT